MKKGVWVFLFFQVVLLYSQGICISNNVSTPDASAMLDVVATNKGILIPRVALVQTTNSSPVTSPATSLLVYNTSNVNDVTPGYYYWNGARWVRLLGDDKAWLLSGNSISSSDFIGTLNNMDFRIFTNNSEKMRVTAGGNVGIGTTSPVERLHVFSDLNVDKSVVYGYATQTSTSTDYRNVGAQGFARGANSTWGNAIGIAGIADKDNSWRAIGVYATLANSLPSTFSYNTALYADGAGKGNSALFMGGRVGINNTSPSYHLHVTGSARIDTFLVVGNPTVSTTIRRAKKEFYLTSTINVQNGYLNSASLGTLDIPPGATSITVTRVVYGFNGYHQDADEQHGVMVRIGSTDFGSIYETGANGYAGVDWINTSYHNTSFTTSQNVYFRIYDASDLFDDNFYVLNAYICIYYEYSVAAQRGDIVASGNIYGQGIYSIGQYGDLAEHYPIIPKGNEIIEPGLLVSFVPESEGIFTLATQDNIQHLAGVISENPTILLNNPSEGYPIAFTGRVKVKLAPSDRLIKSGDFITVSPIPGKGQLATEEGYVVGYAISNQKPGEDFVRVLLQPGRYYKPSVSSKDNKKGKFISQ
ncbi:MAG: hypothetical protein N2Z72_06440 [Bacteroidales bacterium]|nr:hypothetical protein [Bacteroidales bacterium]